MQRTVDVTTQVGNLVHCLMKYSSKPISLLLKREVNLILTSFVQRPAAKP
jgi:hypothetical protein